MELPISETIGTLQDLLDRVATRIDIELIDELWIFPPRRAGLGDSTVIAISAYDEEDPERRRIVTARFNVSKEVKDPNDKKAAKIPAATIVEEIIDEHGTAPVELVSRVIEGV